MKRPRDTSTWVALGGTVLAGLAGGGWVVWRLMLLVSPNGARLWALVATALVPATGYACWRLGQLEARGRLAGIDQAIAKVGNALVKSSGRTAANREQAAPPVALPDVEITHRGNEDRGDVVRL